MKIKSICYVIISAMLLFFVLGFARNSNAISYAPIKQVQTAVGGVAGTTFNLTLSLTPKINDVLTLGVTTKYGSAITVSSVTETGVTWSFANRSQEPSYHFDTEIWYGIVSSSSADTNINITTSASSSGYGTVAGITEWSGISITNTLDKTATNSSSGTTQADSGTTGITQYTNELWFAALGGNSAYYGNDTNGFSVLTQFSNTFSHIETCQKVVNSTGNANTMDTKGSSGDYSGCIATFQAESIPEYNYAADTSSQNELPINGSSITHTVNWTGLDPSDTYIFSWTPDGSTWTNDTAQSFSGSSWSNVTKTINAKTGTTISWTIYANHTGYFGQSPILSYTVKPPNGLVKGYAAVIPFIGVGFFIAIIFLVGLTTRRTEPSAIIILVLFFAVAMLLLFFYMYYTGAFLNI